MKSRVISEVLRQRVVVEVLRKLLTNAADDLEIMEIIAERKQRRDKAAGEATASEKTKATNARKAALYDAHQNEIMEMQRQAEARAKEAQFAAERAAKAEPYRIACEAAEETFRTKKKAERAAARRKAARRKAARRK